LAHWQVSAVGSVTKQKISLIVHVEYIIDTLFLILLVGLEMWCFLCLPGTEVCTSDCAPQLDQQQSPFHIVRQDIGTLKTSWPVYKKDIWGGVVYLTVLCYHIPTLFSWFLLIYYPYILLHFYPTAGYLGSL